MLGKNSLRRVGIAFAVLALSACATPPKVSSPTDATSLLVCEPMLVKSKACAEAIALTDARTQAFAAINSASAATSPITATGRAAIRQGRQGGSVGFEWVASGGADFELTLTAPMGMGRWQVTQKDGQATLTGMPGGPRTGTDAAALVQAATGFDLPVKQLGAWLQGLPAEGVPSTRMVFEDGRLVELEQSGWTLQFKQLDANARPTLIEAARGDAHVRLVVSQWSGALGVPANQ